MTKLKDTRPAWAIKWCADSKLDGRIEHFVGNGSKSVWLFHSRQRARDEIKQRYGYIANRKDLQGEPHGWRMPRAVRVNVTVTQA